MQTKMNQQFYLGMLSNKRLSLAAKSPVIDVESVLISDDSTSDLPSKSGQIEPNTKVSIEDEDSGPFSSSWNIPCKKNKNSFLREKKHFKQQGRKSAKKSSKRPCLSAKINDQAERSNGSVVALLNNMTSQSHPSLCSQIENKQPMENRTVQRAIFQKIQSELVLKAEKKRQWQSADQPINITSFQNTQLIGEVGQLDSAASQTPFVIRHTKKIDKSNDTSSSGDGVMTRRQAESMGLNFIDQVGFVDKEEEEKVLSRRAVLAIPKVRAIIDELSAAIKTKLHHNSTAKVLEVPVVSIDTVRHSIYAQCLKLQLQKRRFIYLD